MSSGTELFRLRLVSDSHGNLPGLASAVSLAPVPDALAFLGDYFLRESLDEKTAKMPLEEFREFALAENLQVARETKELLELPGCQYFALPGNQDLEEAALQTFGENCVHRRIGEIAGRRFFGYGGAPSNRPRATEDWRRYAEIATKFSDEELGSLLRAAKPEIILSHIPPRGARDRYADGSHWGSLALADYALERQPLLICAGHIHTDPGVSRIGRRTTVVNPGWLGKAADEEPVFAEVLFSPEGVCSISFYRAGETRPLGTILPSGY